MAPTIEQRESYRRNHDAALYGGMDALLYGRRVLTAIAQGQAAKDATGAGSRTAEVDCRGRLAAFLSAGCMQRQPETSGEGQKCHGSRPFSTSALLAGVLVHLFDIGLRRASGLTLSWDAHSSLLYIEPGHY